MNLKSDSKHDIPRKKATAGSYEWWYFDGADTRNEYQFVVIFYEGCPFSSKYIRSFERYPEHIQSMAESHPAVSISVYRNGKTIFYSLSEYSPSEVKFNRDKISIRIGRNTLEGFFENDQLVYALRLEENLPSGDYLSAILRFVSPKPNTELWSQLRQQNASASSNHEWNLVQPRAHVKGVISISRENKHEKPVIFEGTGYHDHNIGSEPLKKEFKDWYWGRIHFNDLTLVYYIMGRGEKSTMQAWLISAENQTIVDHSVEIIVDGMKTNRFSLSSARRIQIRFEKFDAIIQANQVVDSGPFYMRFLSEADLTFKELNDTELGVGISEYIRPARIHSRLFWPLVHMRYRFAFEKPHWVQRSPSLFRWTW